MSTYPIPRFTTCPLCKDLILLTITRGAGPSCPGPAQTIKGSHYCKEYGWEVRILAEKMTTTLPWSKEVQIIPREGELFSKPIVYKRRVMKFNFKKEKT